MISIHFSILAGIATVLSFIFYYAFASLQPNFQGSENQRFQKSDLLPTQPSTLWTDYRIYAAVVFTMLLATVLCFW